MIRRLFPRPGLSALLTLVWLLLLNRMTVGGLLLAMVLGTAIPLFTAPFWHARPAPRLGWPMLGYAAVVLWDIVVANFHVAWLILFRPARRLRTRWLVVPLELGSAEAITMLAATISLTPGTVSADVSADGRFLLVHALDTADEAAEVTRIKARYEARLGRMFA